MAVRVIGNILYIEFRMTLPNGKRVVVDESSGLKDNPRNRKRVEDKDKAIKYHLKNGTFDYLKFFPDGSKRKYFRNQNGTSFSKYWERWYSTLTVRYNTDKNWRSSFNCHIKPYFGEWMLGDITYHELLIFRKMLVEEKGLKPSTVNQKIMKVISMVLKSAKMEGLIEINPMDGMKRLTEPKVDVDPFSPQELKHLLEIVREKRPEYYDMIYLWSMTGLRPGELCALKWKNVDYYNNQLLIRETRHDVGGDGAPKTTSSEREITLRSSMVECLKRQEARTRMLDGYVFLTRDQNPFTPAFLKKKWDVILRLAGLRYRPPKQMRHTFASINIQLGENIVWVSKTMGHASVKMTLDTYTRYIPDMGREDGDRLERILGDSGQVDRTSHSVSRNTL